MTVSGALALIVCVLFIASACSKEQKEKKGQGLIFVPILAMVGIYFAGKQTCFTLQLILLPLTFDSNSLDLAS